MEKNPDTRRETKRVIVAAILLILLVISGLVYRACTQDETKEEFFVTAPALKRGVEQLRSSPEPKRTPDWCIDNPFVPKSVDLGDERFRVVALSWEYVGSNKSAAWPADSNPDVFAWTEQSAKAAVCQGAMLLTAHTYPQGSEALGNYLLDKAKVGNRVQVMGANNAHVRYTITDRTEYSADSVPPSAIYQKGGVHRVYIIVCSGRRLSPGVWTHRTVWMLEMK